MSGPEQISNAVARRYLLGRQGLWPGRRWRGKAGAAQALAALEQLQMDSVRVVERSHDLVLGSRVVDYQPALLASLLYQDRSFFDYGGHLDIYPMSELPYWRLHMRRRLDEKRYADFAANQRPLLDAVLAEVQTRGPLNAKDLPSGERVASYRGGTNTQLALYYLWITGELMTHERRGFERVYDLRQRVAPPELDYVATEDVVERYFASKALRALALGTLGAWTREVQYAISRRIDRQEASRWLDRLVAQGEASRLMVEGQSEPYYLPTADLELIEQLAAGETPHPWQPLAGVTTTDEAVFLSPLDNLLHRQRTRQLFDFEHLWEIYKPAAKRRWGAYTMPVLFRDRLVARIEPKLERKTGVLRIDGFWAEDDALIADPGFASALARGLDRFTNAHVAHSVEISGIDREPLRGRLLAQLVVATA